VVYLNQMVLTHRDAAPGAGGGATLARRLIDLYFTLFKLVLEGKVGTAAGLAAAARDKKRRQAEEYAARRGRKKAAAPAPAAAAGEEEGEEGPAGTHSGEMDARMLSALITGVRRAFPYVASEEVEPLVEAHAGERRRCAPPPTHDDAMHAEGGVGHLDFRGGAAFLPNPTTARPSLLPCHPPCHPLTAAIAHLPAPQTRCSGSSTAAPWAWPPRRCCCCSSS
jgi:hypothetical protein